MSFVAYYRVSTSRQGKSGLGLDAQRTAVAAHVMGRGELLAEFTEVESGKRNDRPELLAALAHCRKHRARLVIAKLDRLARNVAFIANLMESGVEFVACDMPEANRLTLHILAAVAEHEREAISRRTKEALAQAKARGTRLGNPQPAAAAAIGRMTRAKQARDRAVLLSPLVSSLRQQGLSFRAIATELQQSGVPAPRGRTWSGASVLRILAKK